MSRIPVWFERKFEFNFPAEQYPNLLIRLRGTPARLEEIVRGVAGDRLIAKPKGKWSAQEHAGHLLDLEPLWSKRLEDYQKDVDTLTVADLTNRMTNEAAHNARPIEEIVSRFRAQRRAWIDQAAELHPELVGSTRLHPRLKQPMRLVDHLFFVAEHDDHHLARIWELISG